MRRVAGINNGWMGVLVCSAHDDGDDDECFQVWKSEGNNDFGPARGADRALLSCERGLVRCTRIVRECAPQPPAMEWARLY